MNKIFIKLSGVLFAIMVLTPTVMVQAKEVSTKHVTGHKIYEKSIKVKQSSELGKVQAKAAKLCIDKRGLTVDQAKVKIKSTEQLVKLQAKATKLGVDKKGFTVDQAKVKIKSAEQLAELQAKATKLGVDIT